MVLKGKEKSRAASVWEAVGARERGAWVVLDSSVALPTLQLCGLGQITSPRELSFPSHKNESGRHDHSTPMGPLRFARSRRTCLGVCGAAASRARLGQPRLPASQREVAQPLSGLSARRAGVLGPGLISSG